MATFSLIQTYRLTTLTALVEFDPIPQTFNHLWLMVNAKSNRVEPTADDIRIILDNNSTGSENIRGYGGTGGLGQDGGAGASFNYVGFINGTETTTTNRFGSSVIIFLDYATSKPEKPAFALGGGSTSSDSRWQLGFSNYHKNTSSPITKIGLQGYNQVSGLVAGSVISLYGISNT